MKDEKVLAPLSISIIIIILLQIALGVGNSIFSRMVPDSRFAKWAAPKILCKSKSPIKQIKTGLHCSQAARLVSY